MKYAGTGDGTIESQLSVNLLDDLSEYTEVLLQSVRIEGRHHATHSQLGHIDDNLTRA